MMNGHPIEPMGVASKLKGPLKCSYADMSRARLDWRRSFRVSSVYGRSWSQRKLGKESETPAKMESKWALKMRMACLDILQQWTSGGIIWKVQFHPSTMVQQYLALASLSRNWRSTLWSLDLRTDMMML